MPEKLTDHVRDIAFDAMCVWEWAQDMLAKNYEPLTGLCDRHGTCTVRDMMLDLLPYVRESWDRAKEAGYEECFDWEFVPWFMGSCVDFSVLPWVCDTKKLPPNCDPPERPAPVRDGFAIFCHTLGAPDLVGTITEGDSPTVWEVFETEREAQLSILEDMEECIRQFKEGERDYDDLDPGLFVRPVTLHVDGSVSTEDEEFPPPEQ